VSTFKSGIIDVADYKVEYHVSDPQLAAAIRLLEAEDFMVFKKNAGRAVPVAHTSMECLECKVPVHYAKGNDGYERLCNVDGSFHICEVVNRILDEFIQENSKLLGELAKGSK